MNNITPFLSGLTPEPQLTVTEWAEKYRKLSSKGSAEPGPYRVARTPYLIKIQNVLSFMSGVLKIIFMKSSQVGATEVGFNFIGYMIDQVPGPLLYLMPTLETMKRNVKQRIDPMIEDTPTLLAKVGKKRSKDGGNTLSQKDFTGGSLILAGANSAASLSSFPARAAILDEVDRYPDDVEEEGSPISLVDKRQVTFGDNKKTFMLGTPTIAGASRIETEFLLTDQQYYYVPCPHCGTYQILKFQYLKWQKGRYHENEVHYQCTECTDPIYNHHKTAMLANGEWRAHAPQNANPKVMGFHISSLYSPPGWMTWEQIAKEWDDCENDEPKKKAFINTILGETYKIQGDAPPWELLYNRSQNAGLERNKPWPSVAILTAGVDVQADRLEIKILGWMQGRSAQEIDYRVIEGDTSKDEVWQTLGELFSETWAIDGTDRTIALKLMAVDAQFNTSKVHDFCIRHTTRRAIPIQGRDHLEMPFESPKAVTKTKLGKATGKLKVWGIGVSYLKTQLYGWLRLSIPVEGPSAGVIPPGYVHLLPHDTAYFRGLTAEELVPQVSKKTNATTYVWVKQYLRNEPLDTHIYATAAAYILGIDRWSPATWAKHTAGHTTPSNTITDQTTPMALASHPKPDTVIASTAKQPQNPPSPSQPQPDSAVIASEAKQSPPAQPQPSQPPKHKKPPKDRRSKGGFW